MATHKQVIEDEMRSLISWFCNWDDHQKDQFLRDLVSKAVPFKLFALMESMEQLSVDQRTSVFQCQRNLFRMWFDRWTVDEQNEFMRQLEDVDSVFVYRVFEEVALTSGKP